MTSSPASRGSRRPFEAQDLALVVVFTALIAVCALLPAIKTGGAVPITLQTFGVLLTGAVLGARRGLAAVMLYLLLGFVGLPIFSGGAGGPGVFAGATAGYLVGFPLAAALCGFLVERLPRAKAASSVPLVFAAGLLSSAVFIHTLGMTGLVLRADMSWRAAWATDSVFWVGDVVKNICMAFVATAVHRAFPGLLGTPPRTTTRERETIEA